MKSITLFTVFCDLNFLEVGRHSHNNASYHLCLGLSQSRLNSVPFPHPVISFCVSIHNISIPDSRFQTIACIQPSLFEFPPSSSLCHAVNTVIVVTYIGNQKIICQQHALVHLSELEGVHKGKTGSLQKSVPLPLSCGRHSTCWPSFKLLYKPPHTHSFEASILNSTIQGIATLLEPQ
jgi:hypothetical protein